MGDLDGREGERERVCVCVKLTPGTGKSHDYVLAQRQQHLTLWEWPKLRHLTGGRGEGGKKRGGWGCGGGTPST